MNFVYSIEKSGIKVGQLINSENQQKSIYNFLQCLHNFP